MDFVQISRALLLLLGGKENIASAAHCATRLRLVLVEDAKADTAAIGKIDGVKGCFRNAGQLQVILGLAWSTKSMRRLWRKRASASPVNRKRPTLRPVSSIPSSVSPDCCRIFCPDYSGDRCLRPADGPAGHGQNLWLG